MPSCARFPLSTPPPGLLCVYEEQAEHSVPALLLNLPPLHSDRAVQLQAVCIFISLAPALSSYCHGGSVRV